MFQYPFFTLPLQMAQLAGHLSMVFVPSSFPVSHKVGNVVNFVLDFKCK